MRGYHLPSAALFIFRALHFSIATRNISRALDALDRLIAAQEARTATDQRILRRMVHRLCCPNRLPPEQRVKKIAGLMRRFTFLCRLDDQRNELQSLRDDFVTLESGQRVPASEIPHWRREFYTDIAAMMILDQQLFAGTDVSG